MIRAKLVSQDQRQEWNALAEQERSFALLQSWEWGEFKMQLGWKVFRVAIEDEGQFIAGAQLLIKPMPLGVASIAYVPRGPMGRWLDLQVGKPLLAQLHHIARAHQAIFLKIEPPLLNDPIVDRTLQTYSFFPSLQRNQPRATLILDLTEDIEIIYKNLRKKTRQYINNSSRAGVVVRLGEAKDLPAFFDLLHHTGQREHFPTHPRSYYEYEWETFAKYQEYMLFMAFYQDQLIAVRTAHRFGKHASEFHAGSLDQFSSMHPNFLLTWQAINWAKHVGCQTYDLWGIPDEIAQGASYQDPKSTDDEKGLWGVYQFKRGFTKNIVCYAGAYDYVYNWPIYRLITSRFLDEDMFVKMAVLLDSIKEPRRKNQLSGSSLPDECQKLENI